MYHDQHWTVGPRFGCTYQGWDMRIRGTVYMYTTYGKGWDGWNESSRATLKEITTECETQNSLKNDTKTTDWRNRFVFFYLRHGRHLDDVCSRGVYLTTLGYHTIGQSYSSSNLHQERLPAIMRMYIVPVKPYPRWERLIAFHDFTLLAVSPGNIIIVGNKVTTTYHMYMTTAVSAKPIIHLKTNIININIKRVFRHAHSMLNTC